MSSTQEVPQESLSDPTHKKAPRAGKDKLTPAAILTLIGGMTLQIMIGTQFAWGNISPYVTGYYRDQGSSVRLTDFYSVLPVIVIFSTLAFPVGMYLAEKYHPKLYAFI